jgi:hypothetical protein
MLHLRPQLGWQGAQFFVGFGCRLILHRTHC